MSGEKSKFALYTGEEFLDLIKEGRRTTDFVVREGIGPAAAALAAVVMIRSTAKHTGTDIGYWIDMLRTPDLKAFFEEWSVQK